MVISRQLTRWVWGCNRGCLVSGLVFGGLATGLHFGVGRYRKRKVGGGYLLFMRFFFEKGINFEKVVETRRRTWW